MILATEKLAVVVPIGGSGLWIALGLIDDEGLLERLCSCADIAGALLRISSVDQGEALQSGILDFFGELRSPLITDQGFWDFFVRGVRISNLHESRDDHGPFAHVAGRMFGDNLEIGAVMAGSRLEFAALFQCLREIKLGVSLHGVCGNGALPRINCLLRMAELLGQETVIEERIRILRRTKEQLAVKVVGIRVSTSENQRAGIFFLHASRCQG